MNTIYLLLLLFPRLAQSAPNGPLYLARQQAPLNAMPTFFASSAQPTSTPAPDITQSTSNDPIYLISVITPEESAPEPLDATPSVFSSSAQPTSTLDLDIAQDAPDGPLYLSSLISLPGPLDATPTFFPSSAQPTTTPDLDPFLLPVPTPTSYDSDRKPPNTPPNTPLVMAYYPDWAGDDFPPEKIDFSRFDWIDFAFALPTRDATLTWDDPAVPGLLTRLVAAARSSCTEAHCTKVKLSIGGWTDSKYFSTLVGTDQSRKRFVENIVNAYYQFNVSGIDIDWEYPGVQGAGNNIVNACDSANFLKFLQLLRSALPSCAKITAATQTVPFAGPDGNPLQDVSAFAKVLDWILLMNYDVWGSSANPGPNAPLSDNCQNSTQPEANAEAACQAWTRAGFNASQLALGVPSYGYVSKSTATRLRTRQPGVVLVSDGNQIQFRELVRQGALVRLPDGSFNGTGGFNRDSDKCSSTPYLWSGRQVVTYDDPESLGLKAAFAKEMGMCGVTMFDVHGDTDGWDLVDAIRGSLL